jgi:precorrin-3B C17-methyltransferase
VGWSLAQKDEMIAVVPASYHPSDLQAVMDRFPTVCLLKTAPVLPQLESMLRLSGTTRRAIYVENLGTPREWITSDLAQAVGRKDYFSLVLVQDQRDRPVAAIEPKVARTAIGKVWVVGLGPGSVDLLTNQGREILQRADDIVGYDAYLRSLAPLGLRAQLHPSPIGAETERASQTLELARAGRQVALVSSGDAGIYGMASLMLESAASMPEQDVVVVPGVTAATAAAALLGSPLGHDLACVSLSDLLTPWEVIEQRLESAGHGDFVLALYNPISQRRTWQLQRARDILLRYRSPQTPVGLVDKAYRPGTRVWQTTLGGLGTEGISMETLLIIGSSQTRIVNGRMVTPRGYGGGPAGQPLAETCGSSATGRQIMQKSFAIIERELQRESLPGWAFAVLRRMIHASADFEFAQTLRYSPDFEQAMRSALGSCAPIVTDTEMVLLGIRTALARYPGTPLVCLLNDPKVPALAASAGLTRSAAGMRLAAQRHAAPILAIGNAPTAVEEALRLVEEEGWRPAAMVAMPVGFVGVEEAKRRLLEQSLVPYLTCLGRKGGSAVTAAAINALFEPGDAS